MPLIKSGSREAIGTNIREMQAAGHSHDQSVAAALRNAREYGAHMAGGGFTPPIGEHMAARQNFREGFLHSSVPGRTDRLPISVAGGSYVLPADHVAALGQGNSNAGAAIVNKMFHSGPAGTPASSQHAARAPSVHLNLTPKVAKFAEGGDVHDNSNYRRAMNYLRGMHTLGLGTSSGKGPEDDARARTQDMADDIRSPRPPVSYARGGHGKPTKIIAAGGEIVLTPEQIIRRFGSLEKGHKALDHWVNTTRKKHIKTLRGLKPPKKD